MKLSAQHLGDLCESAKLAAQHAAGFIRAARPAAVEMKRRKGSLASRVLTDIDKRCQAMIEESLQPTLARYDLALLAEEGPDRQERKHKDHFWCIDPLDGTLPFVEGAAGFSVSIALVARDGRPLLGVVCDPVTQICYHAIEGQGAYRNHSRWSARASDGGEALSVFADRSFRDQPRFLEVRTALADLANAHGCSELRLRVGAGAVMNACWALECSPGCYFKFPKPYGGGSLWDFAATACLFREAGAVATDIHGAPLDLNRRGSTELNHRGVLFASDFKLALGIRQLHERLMP